MARVDPNYRRLEWTTARCLSYSILVKSHATHDVRPIDYDPDGDIKP